MDFLLKKFIRDIEKWYIKNFDGIDLEERCLLHCRIARSRYNPKRFKNNLRNERIKFLNEVQEAMNLEVIKRHNQM